MHWNQAWILSKTPSMSACRRSMTPSPAQGVAWMASGFAAITAEMWEEKSMVQKGAQAMATNSTSGRYFFRVSLKRAQVEYPYS